MNKALTPKAREMFDPTCLDVTNPKQFSEFVVMAEQLQNQIDLAWKAVKEQMESRKLSRVEGDWGYIRFEEAELLAITDESVLDPAMTKAALDTKKVRSYRELLGELPAGVASKNITKFVRRFNKKLLGAQ